MRHLWESDTTMKFSHEQRETFDRDGFLIVEGFLSADEIEMLRSRFEPLFRGEFETGLYPDEWNWREGKDPNDLTRQICNGWKSDYSIAKVVLSENVGRLCADLRGWPGTRINQDNVIWKPPGAKSLAFHQDESYQGWIVPGEYVTCWITLDDTNPDGGTIQYVRGSHRWALSAMVTQFHAPDDYGADLREAAKREGVESDIVSIVAPAGSAVFHHGRTWHGSGVNLGDTDRRSVVSHCMSSAARYHPTNVSYIYNRYKKVGSTEMDESFFPVLWSEDGRRSDYLEAYLEGHSR